MQQSRAVVHARNSVGYSGHSFSNRWLVSLAQQVQHRIFKAHEPEIQVQASARRPVDAGLKCVFRFRRLELTAVVIPLAEETPSAILLSSLSPYREDY